MKSETSFLMPNNYICFFVGLVSGTIFYVVLYFLVSQYPNLPIQRMLGPISTNTFAAGIYWMLYVLFFWGIIVIMQKGSLVRYEKSGLSIVGENLDTTTIISKRSQIDVFRSNVTGAKCAKVRDTALVQTLLFLIDHCLVTGSSDRILEIFTKRLDTLERHIESSYNLLRYIAWAIPSLGFIGTVLGIGSALSNVGDAMQDMNMVTRPLGMAFDTTLIALIASMILMFFLYNMQRKEENLLNSIDLFCQEKFIINLQLER